MASTSRVVTKSTGIDLAVEVPSGSPVQTTRFQVIAVTNLPHYKNPRKHDLDTTIQFGQERDYKDFRKLGTVLTKSHAGLLLPQLPSRPSQLPVGDRVKVLTMFMDAIASSRALCTDPVVAEFLGFSRQRVEAACEAFKALKKKKEKADLFAEDDAAASAVQPLSGLDLSESEDEDDAELNQVLAKLQVEGGSFLTKEKQPAAELNVELDEETSELLSVTNDDLAELMKAPKPKPKGSSSKTDKPKPAVDPLDDLFGDAPSDDVDVSDIAAYLKANQAKKEVSLFD